MNILKTEEHSGTPMHGGHPAVVLPITLAAGENLVAGTVLGRIAETGLYAAYDNDAATGVETAVVILARDTDATDGNKATAAYFHGEFMDAALTWKDADARAAGIPQLISAGIYVHER